MRPPGIFRCPNRPEFCQSGSVKPKPDFNAAGRKPMKPLLLVALSAVFLGACATSAPPTAWGKPGVSMLDYRMDAGQCAVLAATATPENNGSNTAGGIDGSNTTIPPRPGEAAQAAGPANPPGAPPSGAAFPTGGGGMYAENASQDFVQRAATQQRTRDMAIQKARGEALKTCLVERGYQEFQLTPDERAHLAKLPQGSDERREYLYKLGTDPAKVGAAPAPAAKSGS
jgi:hypothetical protein